MRYAHGDDMKEPPNEIWVVFLKTIDGRELALSPCESECLAKNLLDALCRHRTEPPGFIRRYVLS